MKVAIIGKGYFGKILYQNLKEIVDITHFIDSKFDFKKIRGIDWAIVATPTHSHYEIAKYFLDNKINVFCEKPLCNSTIDAEELYRIAHKHNLKLVVDNPFLDRNKFKALQDFYSHRRSEITKIQFTWSKKEKPKDTLLNDFLYHDIYILESLEANFKIENLKVIENLENERLRIKFNSADKVVDFYYDRGKAKAKQITVYMKSGESFCFDFNKPDNNALEAIFSKIFRESTFDFKANRSLNLNVKRRLERLKKQINRKIAVVGGGLFGCTIAWILARDGFDVTLFEKEIDLFKGASYVNQYRIHRGYHYPRGPQTSFYANLCEITFRKYYSEAYTPTKHYYLIAKHESKINAQEYEQYLNQQGLFYEKVRLDFVNYEVIEQSYLVDEPIVDPDKLKLICRNYLARYKVKVELNTKFRPAEKSKFDQIINATFCDINELKKQKGKYQYMLYESCVMKLPKLFEAKSLIILDGDFLCFSPFKKEFHCFVDVANSVLINQKSYQKPLSPDDQLNSYVNAGGYKTDLTNFEHYVKKASIYFKQFKEAKYINSYFTYKIFKILDQKNSDSVRISEIEKEKNMYSILSSKLVSCIDIGTKLSNLIRKLP